MVYAKGRVRLAADIAFIEANRLARATNHGDRRAASALLSQSLPRLRNASRAIAGRTMDADDLLSAAVLSTWERWVEGRGPVENAHAYITQAMRNRLKDEMRAPRSRNAALDALPQELMLADDTDRVHAAIDHAIVTTAMTHLPDEQRMLLTHIVVDGRKPQAVAGETGRSAARISSALYRAKSALRIELVRECLRRACTASDCQVDRVGVALRIAAKVSWEPEDSALRAAQACRGCWAGVQAYADLAGIDLGAAAA